MNYRFQECVHVPTSNLQAQTIQPQRTERHFRQDSGNAFQAVRGLCQQRQQAE